MRNIAVSGRPLPSPRMISANIHNDVSAPHTRYSLMVMQYAQLLDHDLTFTPVNRGFGGSIIDCNSCDSAKTVHPECAPISIPPNDPWFPHIERSTGRPKCIPFTRSLPGQLTLGNIYKPIRFFYCFKNKKLTDVFIVVEIIRSQRTVESSDGLRRRFAHLRQ